MKLIFSRKGFDGTAGGHPSPILPDGRLVSLPIPESAKPVGGAIAYEQLRWPDRRRTYADALRQLGRSEPPSQGAHLDPDLTADVAPAVRGWRPAFGQCGAAQTHLRTQGVGKGDLFLFFGWFRQAEERDGRLRFAWGAPDLHALFGYLEVGEVVPIPTRGDVERVRKAWPGLARHPHVRTPGRTHNTLYVAAERSSWAPGLPGAGSFRWSDELRLTVPEGPRSVWRLPACFQPAGEPTLSYHRNPARWRRADDGSVVLTTVGRGQEFVMDADARVAAWVRKTLRRHVGAHGTS